MPAELGATTARGPSDHPAGEAMAFDWRNPERVVPWKPRQRFLLAPLGHAAAESYQNAIRAAQQSASQRTDLDRAKQSWADGLKLRPMDGIVLDELVAGR